MKVLLISPTIINPVKANNPSFVERSRGINPPIGLMYIASYLLRYTHHSVDIYDGQLVQNLQQLVSKTTYDCIGITVVTFTLPDVINTIVNLRKWTPKSKIVVGGTHPTIYPYEMLEWADFVIRGEGEQVLPIVLDNLNSVQRIFSVNQVEKDIDSYPFPYRTDVKKYNSIFSKGCATTIITSRGCPFGCKFCYRPVMGKTLRMRSVYNIVSEIENCVAMGIRDFQFYDDTFTVDKVRAYNIAGEIIKAKLKIRFDVRSRVDMVDGDLMLMLKKAGMVQIRLGIESGVQRVLDRMNKGVTLQQVKKAFLLGKKLGIETIGYIMIGNPGETREDIEETFRFTKQIAPDFVHCAVFTPYPATESYKEWVEKYDRDVWSEFAKNPTIGFEPPVWGDIPREELEDRVTKFYKEYYFRPGYIAKHIWKHPVKYAKAGLQLMRRKW